MCNGWCLANSGCGASSQVAMNAADSDIHPWKKCINCDFRAEKGKDWRGQKRGTIMDHVYFGMTRLVCSERWLFEAMIGIQEPKRMSRSFFLFATCLSNRYVRRQFAPFAAGQVGEMLRQMRQGWNYLLHTTPWRSLSATHKAGHTAGSSSKDSKF